MFDFAWSQIALIAVVALIAIGPKDMPVAIRAITGAIKKARRMASEFQTHVDEMVREANLDEVRNSINEVRSFDIKSTIEKAIDPDHKIRDTFATDPLAPSTTTTSSDMPEFGDTPADSAAMEGEPAVTAEAAAPVRPLAPSFIPPGMIPPTEPEPAEEPEAPAFIPPEIASQAPPRPHA